MTSFRAILACRDGLTDPRHAFNEQPSPRASVTLRKYTTYVHIDVYIDVYTRPSTRQCVSWGMKAHESTTGYGNVWQQMAAYDSVWQRVAAYDSVWQGMTAYGSV